MSSIIIENRALLPSLTQELLPAVLLAPVAPTITVAELIRQAVVQQITALQQQKTMKAAEALSTIEHHYPTAEEMISQARSDRGNASLSLTESQMSNEIAAAVTKALSAFERRVFVLIIDGRIANSLTEEISCWQDHKVTFLRLVPLKGG